MQYFRCLLSILACAVPALAQSQSQSKTSSIENRGNIGVSTPESTSKPKVKLNKADSQFLREALETGRSENEKARLALSRASDQAIKDFAKRLMDDHSNEAKDLLGVATQGGFSEVMSVTGDYFSARSKVDARTGEKRNPAKNDVSLLYGAAFDKEFAKQIVADLQARISKFEAAHSSVTNTDLCDFSTSVLPKLREHLAQAQTLNK